MTAAVTAGLGWAWDLRNRIITVEREERRKGGEERGRRGEREERREGGEER